MQDYVHSDYLKIHDVTWFTIRTGWKNGSSPGYRLLMLVHVDEA